MRSMQVVYMRLIKKKLSLENDFYRIKGQLEGVEQQLYTLERYTKFNEEQEQLEYKNSKPIIHNR